MTSLKANKPYPSDEQIAQVMKDRKLKRISAVQFLRRQAAKQTISDTFVAPKQVKPTPMDKANAALVKTAKAISKGDAKHYDQAAVIDGFLKHGKTISELAEAQKMSKVYCHRILTTKVPAEYAREQAKRKAAREQAQGEKVGA